jgi:hypothetical protein
MQNKPVVGTHLEFIRDSFHQLVFHFPDILSWCKACSVGDSEEMGIDSDGGLPKGGIENHVSCFPPHSRQCLQLFSGCWNLTLMPLNQEFGEFDDVFGLGVIEAYGLDVSF